MRCKLFSTEIICSFPAAAITTLALFLDRGRTMELCLLAALLHELGHLLAMLCVHSRPKTIKIKIFSVDISDPLRGTRGFRRELFIIYAGIAVNFLIAAAALLLFYLTGAQYMLRLFAANLVLGSFNLLPVASLDGGQGLFLILMRRFSYKTAEIVINILTVLLLIPFTVFGFILLFQSKNNFSLLLISVYLTLSLVLKKEFF